MRAIPTLPTYGHGRIPAAANAVDVHYHGVTCRLIREGGAWYHSRLPRPIRHLRDAVVALRRAIDRADAR